MAALLCRVVGDRAALRCLAELAACHRVGHLLQRREGGQDVCILIRQGHAIVERFRLLSAVATSTHWCGVQRLPL